MIEGMERRGAQAPPEMKSGIDLIVARARARIDELSQVKK